MYNYTYSSLFSTPFAADFGPGLERASEGAQLDGELLSTPLAASFWPGPEEAGRRQWPEVSDFVARFCTLCKSENTRRCENRK